MARSPAKRRTPPKRPAARTSAAPVPRPRPAAPPLESERPHAHVVCRVCGRIQPVELTELDCHLLTGLAEHVPDGWSVERIAFSVAGACQRCREGPRGG